MRRIVPLIAAALGATLMLSACSGSSAETPNATTTAAAEASAAVTTVPAAEFLAAAQQPGTVVIDVRTPAEYAAGHVDGALNINVESSDFAAQIGELPTDTTYAVYCRSGRRSAIATDQMATSGFTSVVNLAGGIADLQAAGAPIATG